MGATAQSKSTPLNRQLFLALWFAGLFGAIALVPYALMLRSANLATIQLPFSLPVVVALQIGQSAIVLAITIAAGLFFANRTGLGTPVFNALLAGESVGERVKAFLLPASAGELCHRWQCWGWMSLCLRLRWLTTWVRQVVRSRQPFSL
jgi:Na+/phosphate symporter